MPVKSLPVLDQPTSTECCTPLALEPLPESDADVLSERFAALGHPLPPPRGRHEPVEPRTQALEPPLLDEAVGHVAGVALRRPQGLAEAGQGDGLLASPLEVQDDLGLVLGEGPLQGFRPRLPFGIH